MKRIMKSVFVLVMGLVMLLPLTGCEVTETPSVNFGFKAVDTAANYDESLSAFEIGNRFYTCITIQINTDKKKAHDYKVVVTVPKMTEVEMEKTGGLNYDSKEDDDEQHCSIMTFTVKGYKEAIPEKIMFHARPTQEGEAEMTVHIYDEDGEEINAGYSRIVFFEYELNTGE